MMAKVDKKNWKEIEKNNSNLTKEIKKIFSSNSENGEKISENEKNLMLDIFEKNVKNNTTKNIFKNTKKLSLLKLFNESSSEEIKKKLFDASNKNLEKKLDYSEKNYVFNLIKYESLGMGIEKVKIIQSYLGVDDDGDFGEKTFNAYIEKNEFWKEDDLESFLLNIRVDKRDYEKIRRDNRKEHFKLIVGVEDFKNLKNIKSFFKSTNGDSVLKMIDFILLYSNEREDFIDRNILEEYLSNIYKNGKIELKFVEGKDTADFTIKEDLTIGEKLAISTYGTLFGNQVRKQNKFFKGDLFENALKKGKTNKGEENFEEDVELGLLKSLFIVKAISDDIKERKTIVDKYRKTIEKEEKILIKKGEKVDSTIDLEARIENIDGARSKILKNIYNRAGVNGNDTLSKILKNKIDLKTERIDLKKLKYGDLFILKREGFFLGSIFLIGKNGKMASKKSVLIKGNKFSVDFGGNSSLEKNVGLVDLLINYGNSTDNYPTKIKISGKKVGKLTKKGRVGFFSGKKYLSIGQDYIIDILEVSEILNTNLQEYKNAFNKRGIKFRRKQLKDNIIGSIHARTDYLIPLSDSEIDKQAFKLEIGSIKSKNIEIENNGLRVKILDKYKFERDYIKNPEINYKNIETGKYGIFREFLDLIAKKESHGQYNAIYGKAFQKEIKFTEMTVSEILRYQRGRLKRKRQTAIGKYQFVNKTLQEMLDKGYIKGNELFNEAFQDKIAIMRLRKFRKLDEFLTGKLDNNSVKNRDKFQKYVSMEWSSWAENSNNKTFYKNKKYEGTKKALLNKAHVFNSEIDRVLDNLRRNYIKSKNGVKKSKPRIEPKNIEKSKIEKSLTLRFIPGKVDYILNKIDINFIKNTKNVFLFRDENKETGKKNLSGEEIKKISNKLLSINSNLMILIDQEGGKVARFKDFNSNNERNNYLGNSIDNSGINESNKEAIKSILEKIITGPIFPGLGKLGETYDSVKDYLKEDYLKAITYLRLKTLKDRGINTYGLVTDLNYGNPVISNSERSFSKYPSKYEKFGKAMIDSAEKIKGISIYLKHFPGHGVGLIDSHIKALVYGESDKIYLDKNIALFEKLIDYGKGNVGMMIGHIILPNEYKDVFDRVIGKSKYVLTDDLGMGGYRLANKALKEKGNENKFFTTSSIKGKHIKISTNVPKGVI